MDSKETGDVKVMQDVFLFGYGEKVANYMYYIPIIWSLLSAN